MGDKRLHVARLAAAARSSSGVRLRRRWPDRAGRMDRPFIAVTRGRVRATSCAAAPATVAGEQRWIRPEPAKAGSADTADETARSRWRRCAMRGGAAGPNPRPPGTGYQSIFGFGSWAQADAARAIAPGDAAYQALVGSAAIRQQRQGSGRQAALSGASVIMAGACMSRISMTVLAWRSSTVTATILSPDVVP